MFGAVGSIVLGATGLVVTSTTPDAICPSLEAAQKAVSARVGEVEGGPFEARLTLVRNSSEGGMTLKLLLLDERENALLERSLPLSESDCSVAAQTVAYVLERHFDGLDAAPEPFVESAADGAPVDTGVARDEPKENPASIPPEESPESSQEFALPVPTAPKQTRNFSGRLGGGFAQGATAQILVGFTSLYGDHLGFNLDLSVPFDRREHEMDGYELESTSAGLHLAAMAGTRRRGWGLYLGPAISLYRQQVFLSGNAFVASERNTRLLAGVSANGLASVRVAGPLWIDLVPRVGGAFFGQAFVVGGLSGDAAKPLPLPALTWDVSVAVRFELWRSDGS